MRVETVERRQLKVAGCSRMHSEKTRSKQVLKNTYTKFFTGDEKILKEKLAQISQALSKAQAPGSVNLFPEMKSNNQKEQDRRGGRKRDSRANRREKAAAAAASEDSWHHVFYTSPSWQGGCYRAARASGPAFSIVQWRQCERAWPSSSVLGI